ncbi:programmed cell death 1 ligand 1-like isoform X2 [Simochromis diagramma]|uniref:programmed cell death 1 ligand 1-like isoform X2 n=1 Tax=Simochromis diagramma TaxID=43689 RepID=UPI001A7EAADD|nr:programmed cell death 1 ligand 1-like isoform X2 [Simochromis diagramma]
MAAKIYIAFWTCLVAFVCADQKNITAESGQDVTLTCRAPNNNPIIVLKWSRADLRDEYVLLYKNKRIEPDDQHPSFKNRVHLEDRQMKDGDVSLILNNVTINDTGAYECRVILEVRQPFKLINTTYLHVVPPGLHSPTPHSSFTPTWGGS